MRFEKISGPPKIDDKLLQIDPKKTFVESVNTLSSLLTGAWIKVAFSLALKGFMEGMGQWKDW